MQSAAFAALGLDWTYELLDVAPGGLPAAIARLRGSDVAGANVTIPHKVAVIDRLDSVDPEALLGRAVHTIANDGGRLGGSKTDVVGIPTGSKARSLGLRTADGWGIPLAQGARSFEIWTGKPAPLDAMRQTLPQ